MERVLGQLQGQLEGIQEQIRGTQRSQDRLEQAMRDHMTSEEALFRELRDQIDSVRNRGEETKWKVLGIVALMASAGTASVKHLWEKLF